MISLDLFAVNIRFHAPCRCVPCYMMLYTFFFCRLIHSRVYFVIRLTANVPQLASIERANNMLNNNGPLSVSQVTCSKVNRQCALMWVL